MTTKTKQQPVLLQTNTLQLEASPYLAHAARGAAINPSLCLVKITPNRAMIPAQGTWIAWTRSKEYPQTQLLDGRAIHEQNIFPVQTADGIRPYWTWETITAALPVCRETMRLTQDPQDIRMQDRWKTMQEIWKEIWLETRGADEPRSLMEVLDTDGRLTAQLGYIRSIQDGQCKRPVRIVYPAEGPRPVAAMLTNPQAILDESLCQVTCRNHDEAHYLLAIMNSQAFQTASQPLCPPVWSKLERSIGTAIWKLPVPEYNPARDDHQGLAALGLNAESAGRRSKQEGWIRKSETLAGKVLKETLEETMKETTG